MNNTNQQHYFKSAWNDEFRCAQCGEYITADRHIRMRDVRAQSTKPAPRSVTQSAEPAAVCSKAPKMTLDGFRVLI